MKYDSSTLRWVVDKVKSLEAVSGLASVNPATGTGNAITDIIKEGSGLTPNKGLTFSISGHTHTFNSLTDKPTTIAGYGIEDAYTKTESSSLFGITKVKIEEVLTGDITSHSHPFSNITSKPTTLIGYGITDAVDSTTFNSHVSSNLHLTDDQRTILSYLSLVDGNLQVSTNLYSTGEVSAFGAGAGGGTGGGLIQTVYGYSSLGSTFNNATLTETFNAYTINKINSDLGARITSLEAGSALTFTTTGTGNGITSVTKSGTSVTVTKGLTFSVDGHTHSYLPLSGGQLTGQLSLLQGADGGIIFPNDSFGGGGDSASIKLLNPAGGESTEMTFTMTNDADDIINFNVPSIDGVKINRYTVWNAGNFTNLNQLTTRNFNDLQNKPTTLSGYGITDAYTTSTADNTFLKLAGGTMTNSIFLPLDLPALRFGNARKWDSAIGHDTYGNEVEAFMTKNINSKYRFKVGFDPVNFANGAFVNMTDADLEIGAGYCKINNNIVWHSGNDGAGSGLDADLLDGVQSKYYLPSQAYHYTNGILVTTSIAAISNQMVTVKIIGNDYGNEQRGIDTIIQFYNYDNGNAILSYGATNNGYNFGNIKVFNYNGKVCLWFQQGGSSQTYYITAYAGITNAVESITNETMPTAGVTREVTIVPKQSALVTDNVASATKLSTDRTNWSYNGVINNVVGQLVWRHYGNNHTIFDASNGYTPTGAACGKENSDIAWTQSYPTLMGYNGNETYGVRVDSSRIADRLRTGRYIFGQYFDGTGNVSGDLTGVGSITASGNISVGGAGVFGSTLGALSIGVSNVDSSSGRGLSLYGGAESGKPTYGIMFAGTGTFGTHGGVTDSWATYLTTSDTLNRGWIFQRGSTNVASISGNGDAKFDGTLNVVGAVTLDSTLSVNNITNFHNSVKLNGSSINVISPDAAGGWARGMFFSTYANPSTTVGGVGAFGSSSNFESVYFGAGTTPWANNSLRITTSRADIDLPLYGASFITANRIFTGFDSGVANSISCSAWFRSSGATGWYNDSYEGGIWMSDSTYVRVFNKKSFWVDNNIVATGEVTAFGASDIRLKSNIKPINSALDFLGKVKTYEFDWNEKALSLNPLKTKRGAGVIAQEMSLLDNNFVHSIYGDYLGVDYERFIPYLIGGVNEVVDEVTILKKRVAELELEVKQLKK